MGALCVGHSAWEGSPSPPEAAASQPLLSCPSGSGADISAGLEAEERSAKAGGSRERARDWQLWRAIGKLGGTEE